MGILLALLSAAVWGTADFAGGFATRRANQYQVLGLSALSGMAVLLVLAIGLREAMPTGHSITWSVVAGMSGAIGLAALYQGLATGNAATVAPTAAVLTAALPAIFTALTVGLPNPTQIIGFALAIVGIWLVSRSPSERIASRSGLGLALIAGCGFGGFLTMIAQVPASFVFGPLAIARFTMAVGAVVLMAMRRVPLPSIASNPVAHLAGVLDAAGNVFYMYARQHTRLDMAAVLSSLYPAATVLLARVILHERINPSQWIGATVCLIAVALIAL